MGVRQWHLLGFRMVCQSQLAAPHTNEGHDEQHCHEAGVHVSRGHHVGPPPFVGNPTIQWRCRNKSNAYPTKVCGEGEAYSHAGLYDETV